MAVSGNSRALWSRAFMFDARPAFKRSSKVDPTGGLLIPSFWLRFCADCRRDPLPEKPKAGRRFERRCGQQRHPVPPGAGSVRRRSPNRLWLQSSAAQWFQNFGGCRVRRWSRMVSGWAPVKASVSLGASWEPWEQWLHQPCKAAVNIKVRTVRNPSKVWHRRQKGWRKLSVFIHAVNPTNPTINIISATNLVASLQLGAISKNKWMGFYS